MTNSKLIWAILMFFVSIISTILIVFRREYTIIDICIIVGMITIAAIGIAGALTYKRYGKGLILMLFAIIVIYLGYLYYTLGIRGNLFSLAITAAIIGLVSSFGISAKVRKRKPLPMVQVVPASPDKKEIPMTASKTTKKATTRKTAKKKAGRKKKAKKRQAKTTKN